MKTYYSSDYTLSARSVVALGCFDGVHIAHARVISEARSKANDLGAQCVVWTFNEPPKNYFLSSPVPLLTDRYQKECAMEKSGVDILTPHLPGRFLVSARTLDPARFAHVSPKGLSPSLVDFPKSFGYTHKY